MNAAQDQLKLTIDGFGVAVVALVSEDESTSVEWRVLLPGHEQPISGRVELLRSDGTPSAAE